MDNRIYIILYQNNAWSVSPERAFKFHGTLRHIPKQVTSIISYQQTSSAPETAKRET